MLYGARPTKTSLAFFLGLASGIMSGVVIWDLIPSAVKYGSLLSVLCGIGLGIITLNFLDRILNALIRAPAGMSLEKTSKAELKRLGLLIAFGIALHDFPEGIAIAAGFSASENLGVLIALAIALHNIPEGMVAAAPLWMGGMSRRDITALIFLIALITPVGVLLGLWLVSISNELVSLLLAFAGGAMAYIVGKELIREALRYGPGISALGAVTGLLVIIFLNSF